jgi:glycosyltransferase involved in cell wall biosynthesis
MKILMLSMFSPHFVNWTEQLKKSGHEVYWLDVYDSNIKVEKISFVNQITGWRYKYDFPGRYYLKAKTPGFTKHLNRINERKLEKFFELKILEIKPDVVHSFVMFIACFPILKVMEKFPSIKWIYSSWGSDMYFLLKSETSLNQAKQVLPKIDYLFTDCERDYKIAQKYGFGGEFLGVFPGGGGFDLKSFEKYRTSQKNRDVILIKGYQGDLGRCIQVLQAVENLKKELNKYQIVIFAAANEVSNYIQDGELKSWTNLQAYSKLPHKEVLQLMGKSVIYIGNSTSDGMPNTLLEAIICGAFPLQSNPGGASAEIIQDGLNGLLINNADDVSEITMQLKLLTSGSIDIIKGVNYNLHEIAPKLERKIISEEVLNKYEIIENQLT